MTGAGPLRRTLARVGLALLAASAVVGGDPFGLRDRLLGSAVPEPRAVASPWVDVDARGERPKTVLRSQPWWQPVRRLRSGGATTMSVPIDDDALQWRARWSCTEGRLVVRDRRQRAPLVDAACPARGSTVATRTGATRIAAAAGGAWEVRIEQQLDVPLQEPPLAAMTAPGARVTATATFQRIDQTAQGRATVYRLADGGHAMRFTGFYVAPNIDLELHLSPLPAPRTTEEFLSAPSRRVAALPVTAGALNFRLPRGVDPARYRSIVIWCPPLRTAYGAATLRPVA